MNFRYPKNPAGINTGNPLENTCIPCTPLALEYLYVTKRMSCQEIAEHLYVGRETVNQALNKIGVPRRSMSQSQCVAYQTERHNPDKVRLTLQKMSASCNTPACLVARRESIKKAVACRSIKANAARARLICPVDGVVFFRKPSEVGDLNYCSRKCRAKARVRECVGTAKLTEWEVYEIRQIYARGGVSQRELAKRFGTVHQNISRIVQGRRWASLKLPSLPPDAVSPSVVRRNAEFAASLGITPGQMNSQM